MDGVEALAVRQREHERDSNRQFQEHAKHIARIEGIYEERTRNLADSDSELRAEIAAMGDRVEKVEARLTAKLDAVADGLYELSRSVVKQGVYIGIGAAVGASLLSVVIVRVIAPAALG
jgi:hypothetical protein